MTKSRTSRKKLLLVTIALTALLGACIVTKKNKTTSVDLSTSTAEPVRTIYFIRHAKSDHNNSSLSDFDRPLDSNGVKDAELMNVYFTAQHPKADYVLLSPSVRTKQTYQRICKGLVPDSAIIREDSSIYRCQDADMLNAISAIPDKFRNIFVIGHNPTMTNMANRFQQEKIIDEVSTGAIAAIRFKLKSWKNITETKGELIFYESPGRLKRRQGSK